MDYANVGKMIKILRKSKKISQERLAEGIMARYNLAKIEKGLLKVSKDKLDLLFDRLGYTTKHFFPYLLTDGEFKAYELRTAFANAQAKYDMKRMVKLIAEMEAMPEFEEGLHKQNLLMDKAIVCLRQEPMNYQMAKHLLNDAINITIPNFSTKLINTYLLGGADHEIIAMMARIAFETGEQEKAISIMEKLAQNVRERVIDAYEKARSLAFVLYNLSRYYGQTGRHREALVVCNEAIEAGEENQAYGLLPDLKYNKAYALKSLNGNNDEEIMDLLYQAYYGAMVHGDKFIAAEIKKRAAELFGFNIRVIF